MIRNEKLKRCYRPKERVRLQDEEFIFQQGTLTDKVDCALSMVHRKYFCLMCGGCGDNFPEGTTAGYFVKNEKAKTFQQLREQAHRLATAADPEWKSPRARTILNIYEKVGKAYL